MEKCCKILNDMLDKYQLIGMSEWDVIQLLGEEDSSEQTSLDDGIVAEYCLDVS